MFIPDPVFFPSWISDPTTPKKRRGNKYLCLVPFFATINLTKMKTILFLNSYGKKFEPIYKELEYFLPKKTLIISQKYGLRIQEPRSGIRNKLIPFPDPGVKKASDPGSGSATLIVNVDVNY
jgi:hypothetical protein